METKDYTVSLTVDASAKEVFNNINHVEKWWNEYEGNSHKLNDEFTVQFGDMHVSTQKLIELIPDKKVVWLVTSSNLSFVPTKDEWTGTKIIFEISEKDNKTQVLFTHQGLVPAFECYNGCSEGWDYFIKGSLFKFLTEGKGTPGL